MASDPRVRRADADDDILARIGVLEEEEHALQAWAQQDDGLDAEGQMALFRVRVSRDQQWDLLRQRRALRDAGRDPDEAIVRDPSTVESFLQ